MVRVGPCDRLRAGRRPREDSGPRRPLLAGRDRGLSGQRGITRTARGARRKFDGTTKVGSFRSYMITRHSRLLLCFLTITGSLAAQPASSTFRTALLESVSIGYSYSSREDLSYGGRVGDVAVQRFDFSLSGRRPWKETVTLAYGFAYADNQLDHSAGVALPDTLGELSLNLGVTQKLSDRWSWSVFVRP